MQTDYQVISSIERLLNITIPHKTGAVHSHSIGYRSLDFRTVTELSLSDLNIEDLSILSGFRHLRKLYLSSNNISDLDTLQEFRLLNVLWLNNNNIINVESLGYLKNLTELWINENQIENLGPLNNLTALESLWLGNNRVSDITALQNLRALQTLDLRSNPITKLPHWIVTRNNLDIKWKSEKFYPEGVTFYNNPLIDPPPEIVQLGKEAIKTWFRSGETSALNEIKILLIGSGEVGKTSIVKCLCGDEPNPDEKATHQINITNHPIFVNDQEIILNYWDFGGQEIMHTTHQFFLSRRSLYLLVLDGRRDEDAEYWLKHIESFGGESPVIVVLNKMDANPRYDVDRIFLQKKYPFITSFCKTITKPDNTTGIIDLFMAIKLALEKISMVKIKWPANWRSAKDEIMNLHEDYIARSNYSSICESHGIKDLQMQEVFAEFLNDLGVAVHFRDLNLSNMFILQPKWVSQAVYKIINSKKISDNYGLFTEDDLSNILRQKYEADYFFPLHTYSFVVTLMQKFELCYGISKGKYLIPELLNIQQPPLPEHKGEVLNFYFEYENLLPKSIFARFIVRMSQDIFNNLCWRTGIVLSVDVYESLATIVADIKEKRIFINVSGPDRRDHFANIRKTFHELHDSFEKLLVHEKIALPGEKNKFVAYSELAGYAKAGLPEYFSGEIQKKFKVQDIMASIESENSKISKFKWDVFLVHSSADKSIVNSIVTDLKDRGIRYWLDDDQIMPGDIIIKSITEGLKNSAIIVPCLSRRQLQSGWTQSEYESVLHRFLGGSTSQRIAPLILDDLTESELPWFLVPLRTEKFVDKNQYKRFLDFLTKKN